MSIGYACLTVGVPNTNFKTCRMDNATEERLIELIAHNLKSLKIPVVFENLHHAINKCDDEHDDFYWLK